jgi:hypothetical protein
MTCRSRPCGPVFRSENSPALKQPYDQDHCGYDQQDMNQATDMKREKSQRPKNDQDDQNGFQHVNLLLFTHAPPARVVNGRNIGPSKSYFFYAIFMPEYFSDRGRLIKLIFSIPKGGYSENP